VFSMERVHARPHNVWRYRELLPIRDEGSIITLGEGWTPITRSRRYGEAAGLKKLEFKLEFLNPTGSLKDRGTTVTVSRARELGVSHVADDTSGNAGASLAAYCAKAGIKCTIYVPEHTPHEKLVQASIYGAEVVRVPGSRSEAARVVFNLYRKGEIFYASHNLSPLFLDGMKTFAFELAEQTGGELPDHIVFPVGGGTLLVGASKGFSELIQLGWVERSPTIHAVQSSACDPIVQAFRKGSRRVEGVVEGDTVAGGIRIARPARGGQVLEAIYQTGGSAVSVTDREILEQQLLLARMEGIFAEPTSCAALAGLRRLVEEGVIRPDESVLVPITGFGLKDVKTAQTLLPRLL